MKNNKKSQISFEYMIIVGFITFIIVAVMGVALFYSGSIRDRIRLTQVTNCANKIISTAESVFYAGKPSRATITCYLPDNVVDIEVDESEQSLIISIQTYSGVSVTAFTSNVPISGAVQSETSTKIAGVKKIKIEAEDDRAFISPA